MVNVFRFIFFYNIYFISFLVYKYYFFKLFYILKMNNGPIKNIKYILFNINIGKKKKKNLKFLKININNYYILIK